MSAPTARLSDPAEVDSYLEEGACLIRAAEERLCQLQQDRVGEYERLAAAEIVKAMKRIHVLIQDHRNGTAMKMALPPVTRRVLEKRRWWPLVARSRGYRAASS